MIDFNKPMRVKDFDRAEVRETAYQWAVRLVGSTLCAINSDGDVYDISSVKQSQLMIENIPEPRVRYQAQGPDGQTTDWRCERASIGALPWRITAWLIETDHGPEAEPRYSYYREEV